MRNVSAAFISKYKSSNSFVKNRLRIDVNEGDRILYNDDIVSQSLRLNQSICDSSVFKIGGCIASQFEIEVTDRNIKKGDKIEVILDQDVNYQLYPSSELYPSNNLYPGLQKISDLNNMLFCGTVYSAKFTKNRITKKIVAYDDFYLVGSVDCTNWYKKLYLNAANEYLTLGTIRAELLNNYFHGRYDTNLVLPADALRVKMISGQVTVLELLRQICEINGVFGFVKGNGTIDFIKLRDTTNDVIPKYEHYNYYIDLEYEDFTANLYDGFYICGFTNGNGFYDLSNSSEYYYLIEDIPLITENETTQGFGQEWSNLDKFGYNNIIGEEFKPFEMKAEYRSWLELGDQIRVDYRIGNDVGNFDSYVLNRTLSGLPAIRDEISASGEVMEYIDDETPL